MVEIHKVLGSLITQDCMRVDVITWERVSEKPEAEAVSYAAQTFGKRFSQPDLLRNLWTE